MKKNKIADKHPRPASFQKYGVFLCMLFLAVSSVEAKPTALEVIKAGDDRTRGITAIARMEMIVHKRRVERSMTIDFWEDRKRDASFIRVVKPAKDAGVAFLRLQKNLWQYIPKLGKEIRIESSLMQESWMGSDFTNDDLVKESSVVEDYTHRFLDHPNPAEYKIELKPKPGVAVIWAKVIFVVNKETLLPTLEEFYDHKGRVKKRMVLSDVRMMGGRLIPTKLKMSTLKNGREDSYTIMIYKRVLFNRSIPASIFSKRNLRK